LKIAERIRSNPTGLLGIKGIEKQVRRVRVIYFAKSVRFDHDHTGKLIDENSVDQGFHRTAVLRLTQAFGGGRTCPSFITAQKRDQ
jgi:hypothetical protein